MTTFSGATKVEDETGPRGATMADEAAKEGAEEGRTKDATCLLTATATSSSSSAKHDVFIFVVVEEVVL